MPHSYCNFPGTAPWQKSKSEMKNDFEQSPPKSNRYCMPDSYHEWGWRFGPRACRKVVSVRRHRSSKWTVRTLTERNPDIGAAMRVEDGGCAGAWGSDSLGFRWTTRGAWFTFDRGLQLWRVWWCTASERHTVNTAPEADGMGRPDLYYVMGYSSLLTRCLPVKKNWC